MTFKQAVFIVATQEVAKAKDWEWTVYCDPKLPRSALKKARLDITAAEMRARRLLEADNLGNLPPVLRAEVRRRMKEGETYTIPEKFASVADRF